MLLLLDTHAFLWWLSDDNHLPVSARQAILDPDNDVCFSTVSAWEIAIKAQQRRRDIFTVLGDPPLWFPQAVAADGFRVLPVELRHALRVYSLPAHHRDPFDRLLVAQAELEGLAIVSRDPAIAQSDVPVVW